MVSLELSFFSKQFSSNTDLGLPASCKKRDLIQQMYIAAFAAFLYLYISVVIYILTSSSL